MKLRRAPTAEDDPTVAAIEDILAAAAPARTDHNRAEQRIPVSKALWICACVTEYDAPIWLIYDTLDGDLIWHRVPAGIEPLDLVDAQHSAGGHAEPAEVLRWLHGTAHDPWSGAGDGTDDAHVTADLRQKIRSPG